MSKKNQTDPSLRIRVESLPIEDLRTLMAKKIKNARESRGLSQEELAVKVSRAGAMIGKYERGEDTPGPIAAALAVELQADPKLWLLYAQLQRAAKEASDDANDPALRVLRQMAQELEDESCEGSPAHSSGKTLADFPQRFDGPFWIVVGDRRESRGKKMTPADFGALSASPADLRYLDNLGLKRRDYQIISDKVFVLAPLEELRRRFADATLVILGSPASSHAARIINRYSLHRFNLPHDYYDLLERLIREAWRVGAGAGSLTVGEADRTALPSGVEAQPNLSGSSSTDAAARTEADSSTLHPHAVKRGVDFFTAPKAVPGLDYWDYDSLEKLLARRMSEVSWQKHTLFNGGLIDPPYKNLIRGMENSPDRDFGIITLAQNPFRSENDGRFPAVFLAGYHLPATCYSLHESIWRDRYTFFKNHPFGGVIRVNLKPLAASGKNFYTYYERMESFSAAWDDDSDYAPEQLLEALKQLRDSQRANFTRDEAGRAYLFLQRLIQG